MGTRGTNFFFVVVGVGILGAVVCVGGGVTTSFLTGSSTLTTSSSGAISCTCTAGDSISASSGSRPAKGSNTAASSSSTTTLAAEGPAWPPCKTTTPASSGGWKPTALALSASTICRFISALSAAVRGADSTGKTTEPVRPRFQFIWGEFLILGIRFRLSGPRPISTENLSRVLLKLGLLKVSLRPWTSELAAPNSKAS